MKLGGSFYFFNMFIQPAIFCTSLHACRPSKQDLKQVKFFVKVFHCLGIMEWTKKEKEKWISHETVKPIIPAPENIQNYIIVKFHVPKYPTPRSPRFYLEALDTKIELSAKRLKFFSEKEVLVRDYFEATIILSGGKVVTE